MALWTHAEFRLQTGLPLSLRRRLALVAVFAICSGVLVTTPRLLMQAFDGIKAHHEPPETMAAALSQSSEVGIARVVALLTDLGGSSILQDGDHSAFYTQTRRTHVPAEAWPVLSDNDRQILNTLSASDSALPDYTTFGLNSADIGRRVAAVSVPVTVSTGPYRGALTYLGMVGGLSLALGIILTLAIARCWGRPFEVLQSEASAAAVLLQSSRREHERTLELLHASMNARSARLALLDTKGRIVLANDAWDRQGCLTGKSKRDVDYASTCETPALAAALQRLLQGHGRTAVVRYEGPAGTFYQAHLTRFDHKGHWWIVVAHEDITEIETSKRAVQNLGSRLTQVQEQERQRIARELHDSTLQHLAALGLNLARLRQQAAGSNRSAAIMADMKNSLREAQRELRVFTYLLHPPRLHSEGLRVTATRFSEGFAQRSGLHVRLRISRGVDDAPFEARRVIFRVMQEAYTNIHRHAGASRVLTIVRLAHGRLALWVRDDGKGLPATVDVLSGENGDALGVGIPGMCARIHQFAGEISIRRAKRGTLVFASVPVAQAGVQAATR